MVITQSDVNEDLRMLMQDIEDDSRPLVRPVKALKLSMAWPLSCALCYAIVIILVAIKFEPYVNHFDNKVNVINEYGFAFLFGGMSIFFALFIGAMLYGPMLAYLTLSQSVRNKSIIINRFKPLVIKLGRFFFICNLSLAVICIWIPDILVASPFVFMFSFLIMQGIVSAEATRYGVGSFMSKLTKLSKKI